MAPRLLTRIGVVATTVYSLLSCCPWGASPLIEATASSSSSDTLCSLPPQSYAGAKKKYPEYAFALDALEKRGIATWYSDRTVNGAFAETAQQLVDTCASSTRLSVVVYGLPNKDCEAGYSATNSAVQTAQDYAAFIDTLTKTIGTRKVLYVLEPDAVGLIVNGGCALEHGYKDNLLVAIDKLSEANENAQIYLDVGFWTLADPVKADAVAAVVKELEAAGRGRVKGITLNTSNYRATKEMTQMCGNFQQAYNSTDLHCIIDTSRNYNDTTSSEWCNRRTGGVGHPPTGDTGIANIDYFVWIKPPGESDGECDSKDHTSEAMVGPEAGTFFPKAFELLWDNGYLYKVEKMAGINVGSSAGLKANVVVAVICGVIVVALAFVGLIVYRQRRTKGMAVGTSRAYFA